MLIFAAFHTVLVHAFSRRAALNEENTIEDYNRPNLNWICTNTEGCGCPGGPKSNGRCPGKLQCTPVRYESSWRCSRSQVHGGTCETGPDPSGNCCTHNIGCVPKRNLRSKRKIFVGCCVAVGHRSFAFRYLESESNGFPRTWRIECEPRSNLELWK